MEIKTNNDLLIEQRNKFSAIAIGELLNIKRYAEIRKENPDEIRVNQMGQKIGISELIKLSQKNLNNARAYLKHVDELLINVEKGTLEDEIIKEQEKDYDNSIVIPNMKDLLKK